MSYFPSWIAAWQGGQPRAALSRGPLDAQAPEGYAGVTLFAEEEGRMGQGPDFKFKPMVRSTALWLDTHPIVQLCSGLFILVNTA